MLGEVCSDWRQSESVCVCVCEDAPVLSGGLWLSAGMFVRYRHSCFPLCLEHALYFGSCGSQQIHFALVCSGNFRCHRIVVRDYLCQAA